MKPTEGTMGTEFTPHGARTVGEAHSAKMETRTSSDSVTLLPLPEGRIAVYPLAKATTSRRGVVLYVHGATFPASLAMGYRFDGHSWADDLAQNGYDAWGFDFLGYGASDRYVEMKAEASQCAPLGRAPAAARQVIAAVRHVVNVTGARNLTLIAHSWGSMPAALCACEVSTAIGNLVLFGPILGRDMANLPAPESLPGYGLITVDAQYKRFTEDVPKNEPAVLLERHFERWALDYLASDPGSARRTPPAVKTPLGPAADIYAAWQGQLPYDPKLVRVPTLLVRGEWDGLCADADAGWFLSRCGAPFKADVKIPRGTHLMHLEESRYGLYRAVNDFLLGPACTR